MQSQGFIITRHAAERLAQRALSESDIDIIVSVGVEVPDGYFLRKRDADEAIRTLKLIERRIERLAGTFAPVAGGRVISAYHADRRKQRHLLKWDPKRR